MADAEKSARLFSDVIKDVTSTGVHVATALNILPPYSRGSRRQRRARNEDDLEGERGVTGLHVIEGDDPHKIPPQDTVYGRVSKQRKLTRYDDKTAKTPFQYHGQPQFRPDQVPRVFGAVTDPDSLETREVRLDELTAMQNRVDPGKVAAIIASAGFKKPAVVVHIGNARYLIMDGHHRLAADWLRGMDTAVVRFKDVGRMSNALKREPLQARVLKVDDGHGLVLGYAIVCKQDGEDYFDLQGDHIPEDAMLGAAVEFMAKGGAAKEMHAGDVAGRILFAWPLTTDIAKAFGITTATTGLMVAMKPDDPAMLAKFRSGDLTGFSIGGHRIEDEVVTD